MIKTVLVSLLLLQTVLVVQSHAAKKPAVFPADLRIEQDTVYLGAERKEKADLYYPLQSAKDSRVPAVIVIHGGGFNDGDKARAREINICSNLARHGYLAMSINYKLATVKGKATWPLSVHDAKTAVCWLRANADRLGINPGKIGVVGCSAGGNLAAMLALTGAKDGFERTEAYPGVSSAVSCAVDFYGAVDLHNYHDMKMFAQTREEAPSLYTAASPVTYVHAGAAPMLIVHGDADEVVPLSQSETLAAALKKAGSGVELVVIPKAPHSFDLEPKERDLRPLVLGFLDRHLQTAPRTAGQ